MSRGFQILGVKYYWPSVHLPRIGFSSVIRRVGLSLGSDQEKVSSSWRRFSYTTRRKSYQEWSLWNFWRLLRFDLYFWNSFSSTFGNFFDLLKSRNFLEFWSFSLFSTQFAKFSKFWKFWFDITVKMTFFEFFKILRARVSNQFGAERYHRELHFDTFSTCITFFKSC